jgi:hypothetical protein
MAVIYFQLTCFSSKALPQLTKLTSSFVAISGIWQGAELFCCSVCLRGQCVAPCRMVKQESRDLLQRGTFVYPVSVDVQLPQTQRSSCTDT